MQPAVTVTLGIFRDLVAEVCYCISSELQMSFLSIYHFIIGINTTVCGEKAGSHTHDKSF